MRAFFPYYTTMSGICSAPLLLLSTLKGSILCHVQKRHHIRYCNLSKKLLRADWKYSLIGALQLLLNTTYMPLSRRSCQGTKDADPCMHSVRGLQSVCLHLVFPNLDNLVLDNLRPSQPYQPA